MSLTGSCFSTESAPRPFLGYAWDRWLLYVKGSAAFVRTEASVLDACQNTASGCGNWLISTSGSKTVTWMDEALLKVVEANKVALQKLTEGGASFEDSSVKKELKELEAFEEKFLDGVKQAAQEASDRTKEQWKSILDNVPRGGTDTGAQVKETLSAHAREAQAAMRSSREAGLKVMHTLTQNYATLVSRVLIGLSEALEHGKPKTKR